VNDKLSKSYFFCGIGGSGMAPLAAIMAAKGENVSGSDRAYDRGQSPEKFEKLQKAGITLFPQDGSGLSAATDTLIVSSAVEETIPDVKAALDQGIPIQKRAELLASLFNSYESGISIAGTSGKSTVTGMSAVMLAELDLDPTVMNGGAIRNFETMPEGGQSLPSMRIGTSDIFVTETDESDGSIALYEPAIAVVNNIALDHKPVEELTALFKSFIGRARHAVVLNFDDQALRDMTPYASAPVYSYAITDESADLTAHNIKYQSAGVRFTAKCDGQSHNVTLQVPGAHNVSNALAALSIARAMDIALQNAIPALEKFTGIARRLAVTGIRAGITVIDDFAHNPDKISASLKTLKAFDGRLLVVYQPHGFGPLKLMGREIIESFAVHLTSGDQLLMPEVYYAGGTADRSVTSKDVIGWAKEKGIDAHWFAMRDEILPYIKDHAREGDRIIVMGARDDTLTDFAYKILDQV